MRKPKVLVVSKYLAPGAEVGGRRFSHLSREFQKRGIDVTCIAASLPPASALDPSLPEPSSLYRVPPHFRLPRKGRGILSRVVNRLTRGVVSPLDPDPLWLPGALRLGKDVARDFRPDLVIGTIPPLSAAIVASRLADAAGCPLILDYRDPWSAYPWKHFLKSTYARRSATSLEMKCIARSAARVFNTPEIREWFEKYFPDADTAHHHVIPNGVSSGARRDEPAGVTPEIIYAGEVYGDRSVLPVLRALSTLHRSAAAGVPRKLVLYGELPLVELQRIQAAGLEFLLERRPPVSSAELAGILRSASCLLVISGSQMSYSIPYKMYDYLAARRPILALSPSGSALCRFCGQFNIGEYADPADQEAVTAALARATAPDRVYDGAALEVHLWSRLAAQYIGVMDSVRGPASGVQGTFHGG